MLIFFLQFSDFVLTIVQRMFEGFVGLHGLLSRRHAAVQDTVPAEQGCIAVCTGVFGAKDARSG